jgi:uncharacterized protein
MHSIELFLVIVFLSSAGAGALGALVGLGGGVLVVPILTIGFGIDIRLAIGASAVSVIATSSGAGATLLKDGLTNIRVATFLQVATASGAICGALLAPHIAAKALFLLFGGILFVSAVLMVRKVGNDGATDIVEDPWATSLHLSGTMPKPGGGVTSYPVAGVKTGFVMMIAAGVISGLLGIGSGALKVLAMDTAMRLPIKVSSATSNFMIGVTAAASAGIYYWRGDVLPLIAAPVALGVLLGSIFGAKALVRFRSSTVRVAFIVVLSGVAVQMILKGFGVG